MVLGVFRHSHGVALYYGRFFIDSVYNTFLAAFGQVSRWHRLGHLGQTC